MNQSITKPHPIQAFFWQARFVMPFVSLGVIIGGTFLAIKYGQGYRPTPQGVQGSGLLTTSSYPTGAEVYLDQKLTTVTNDTLPLPPGSYAVTIKKDSYLPWNRTLNVAKELVTLANATLFKAQVSIAPLTSDGAVNLNPSPDGTKLAYVVASASASLQNGLYVLDLTPTNNPLSVPKPPKLIAPVANLFNLSVSEILWSPDSGSLLVHAVNGKQQYNYLLDPTKLTNFDTARDITTRTPQLLSEWEQTISLRETKDLFLLPGPIQQIATQSATNSYFSPTKDRFMYTATEYVTIPPNLLPHSPSPNQQSENRSLVPGATYVYDLTEDRNYLISTTPPSPSILETSPLRNFATSKLSLPSPTPPVPQKSLLFSGLYQQLASSSANIASTPAISSPNTLTPSQLIVYHVNKTIDVPNTFLNFKAHYSSLYTTSFQWFPDSHHLIQTLPARINLLVFDGSQTFGVYSGPFDKSFIYPTPDGNKLITQLNLNPATTKFDNLYSVSIR